MSLNRRLKFAKLKMQDAFNKQKQTQFNSRFTVPDKTDKIFKYNALQDPHVGYYFANHSVKKHLKSIKNAILKQQTHTIQKQKLKQLFSQKIKIPKANQTKANIYRIEQILSNDALRKASIRSMNSQRSQSIDIDSVKGQSKRSFRYNNKNFHHLKKNHSTVEADLKQVQSKELDINNAQAQKIQENKNKLEKLPIKIQVNLVKIQKHKEDQNQQQKDTNKKKRSVKSKSKSLNHETFINFIEEKKKLLKKFQQSIGSPVK